jgi:hypothetical protein
MQFCVVIGATGHSPVRAERAISDKRPAVVNERDELVGRIGEVAGIGTGERVGLVAQLGPSWDNAPLYDVLIRPTHAAG